MMRSEYQQIVTAANYGTKAEIVAIHSALIKEKMKMDKFFSLYLDKFEKKMDSDKPNTPIWDLYKKKTKEYADLNQSIRAAEYYLRKP
jgi:hypothetical protein